MIQFGIQLNKWIYIYILKNSIYQKSEYNKHLLPNNNTFNMHIDLCV